MFARSLTRPVAALGVALALTACSGAATTPPQVDGSGAPSAGSSMSGSAEPSAAGGPDGYEGALTSSGLYSATWTAISGAAPDPFNAIGNLTLASDKDTFANIRVNPDGSVSFGSGAPELVKNGSYDGTGASATLDSSGQFVCAFTVDTDLKGTNDSAILHLSGNMTVHWHPVGVGDMNCP